MKMSISEKIYPALLCCILALCSSCKKNNDTAVSPQMNFQFRFDPNQERLNNLGQPAVLPAGHAAQTPDFRKMSVHYIELTPDIFTPLGKGAIAYKGAETTKGGDNAVDFDKAAISDENVVFAHANLHDLPPGTYKWIRASVTFQNYDVKYNIRNIPAVGDLNQQSGTVASFVGFNTYITSITPRSQKLAVNANKKQGFWAFETALTPPFDAYNKLSSGEAPAGATTVVNPLFASSPIPAGSCVVTGELTTPLVITGKETADVLVTLSFSINKSFEWIDDDGNGQLDIWADQSHTNEKIVDMGLRGMIPTWQ